jgi:hypothetical protein
MKTDEDAGEWGMSKDIKSYHVSLEETALKTRGNDVIKQ